MLGWCLSTQKWASPWTGAAACLCDSRTPFGAREAHSTFGAPRVRWNCELLSRYACRHLRASPSDPRFWPRQRFCRPPFCPRITVRFGKEYINAPPMCPVVLAIVVVRVRTGVIPPASPPNPSPQRPPVTPTTSHLHFAHHHLPNNASAGGLCPTHNLIFLPFLPLHIYRFSERSSSLHWPCSAEFIFVSFFPVYLTFVAQYTLPYLHPSLLILHCLFSHKLHWRRCVVTILSLQLTNYPISLRRRVRTNFGILACLAPPPLLPSAHGSSMGRSPCEPVLRSQRRTSPAKRTNYDA